MRIKRPKEVKNKVIHCKIEESLYVELLKKANYEKTSFCQITRNALKKFVS